MKVVRQADSAAVVREYVKFHNKGVRTGDYRSMLALFATNAEMIFEGDRARRYKGPNAIAKLFLERPPDDTLVLSAIIPSPKGQSATARYGWSAGPSVPGGELRIATRNGRIRRLVVAFDSISRVESR